MRKIIFTTSWDDGHVLDFKIAEILGKYGLKGTFYVAKEHSRGGLAPDEISKLFKTGHEIGAHTLTHPELDKISLNAAKDEIFGSKKYLENIINQKVEMFCYPRGKYNEEIKRIVIAAGFLGARTTSKFNFMIPQDCYECGVSLHIYPFPFRKKNSGILWGRPMFDPLRKNFSTIRALKLPLSTWTSWQSLARNLFDYALSEGEVFHLYGHSWEVEKYGMWGDLDNFLCYVTRAGHPLPLSNGELLKVDKKHEK